MKVLLHTCCGPCASACVPRLAGAGHDVTMFFSNSNIDTGEEFRRRLDSARRLGAADGVEVAEDAYDHGAWLREAAAGLEDEPEKGGRCARCFRFSLSRAAEYAAAHGYDAVASSLTVSPHKVSDMVFAAGDEAVRETGGAVVFLREDFKKKEGFRLSVRRAAELGLYRQSYCGCEFSRREARPAPSERRQQPLHLSVGSDRYAEPVAGQRAREVAHEDVPSLQAREHV